MDKLIVVLNKIDMFKEAERESMIEQQRKKLQNRFGFTRFSAQIPIVPVSAAPRIDESEESKEQGQPIGIDVLINTILENLDVPDRLVKDQPFLFSIDHCF